MNSSSQTTRPRTWPTTAVCLLLGLALTRLPAEIAQGVRSAVADVVTPVEKGRVWLRAWWQAQTETELAELKSELELQRRRRNALETMLRSERLRTANLNEALQRMRTLGAERYQAEESNPLLVPELIRADVVGTEQKRLLRSGVYLSAGNGDRVIEDSLVLAGEADGLVLDQGRDRGVPAEAPVYAGRCVAGRIESVGRWTSLVRLVTDAGYRGRAQILRTTADGSTYGPECILEGTGEELCRLRYLDRTESVEVGEEVYTGGRSASMPYPMYYGKIVKAELDPSDREWTVWVKPAIDPKLLQTVQILTQTANSIRILGH